jgi:SAM-dependent methyltransferase
MAASACVTRCGQRWNHNIHYHRLVLAAVPPGCQRVLDVGCGEGMLAPQLARLVQQVVGIDQDAASIDLARRQDPRGKIGFICGDFLTHPLAPASFNMITSVAALHHMDARAALDRMDQLLVPGGTLAIVGLARSRLPTDLPYEAAAVTANLGYRLTRTYWEQPSPTVWPPPHTYTDMQALAPQALPGVHYRRHLLWRYSLVWAKPSARSWAMNTPGWQSSNASSSADVRDGTDTDEPGHNSADHAKDWTKSDGSNTG